MCTTCLGAAAADIMNGHSIAACADHDRETRGEWRESGARVDQGGLLGLGAHSRVFPEVYYLCKNSSPAMVDDKPLWQQLLLLLP